MIDRRVRQRSGTLADHSSKHGLLLGMCDRSAASIIRTTSSPRLRRRARDGAGADSATEVVHLKRHRLRRFDVRRHDVAGAVLEELAERLGIADSGPRDITPASYTRTGSLLQSSYTTIFFDPTTVVRRSLLGASQDNST